MIAAVSGRIAPGDIVRVYDPDGEPFGAGFYNAKARVPLRMIHHRPGESAETGWFLSALDDAIALRRDILHLDEGTEAYRVVNSDGDGLSGLIIDRFADVLSAEVHSLGIWQRLPEWLPHLHSRLGTTRAIVRTDPAIARIEGIPAGPPAAGEPRSVRIREHGIRFEVSFADGHKTGFFCDQRDNRRKFAGLVNGRRVLDLCCYTGGFALAARINGRAASVTAVDLDEKAIAQARRNSNLNQVRDIDWVHTDAFTYARQMHRNGAQWDAVVLDPPKLVHTREDEANGRGKYADLNALALDLVAPGGLFLTCSCSGLLDVAEFEQIVLRSAGRRRRRLQILDRTGAGPDHPVMSNCPEGRYLKTLWARVW